MLKYLRNRYQSDDDEGKPNLTPMIDIVFLLLVFFILTTTFTDEEMIRSLLSTTDGGEPTSHPIDPPAVVRITVLPAGLPKNAQPSELEAWLAKNKVTEVVYSIAGKELTQNVQADKIQRLEELHDFISHNLVVFEENSAMRKDESPVEILCYSGLAWHDALSVYDAVRSYERLVEGPRIHLAGARKIDFGAPNLRNSNQYTQGNELYRLQHTHAY